MGRLQERIWVLSSLLTFLTDPGFGYSIIQGPHNLTILAGSVARFNCTVSEGWSVLIWLHNEWPQLTVENSGKVLNQDKRYSQQNYTSGTEFTSELMIYDVQPKDSGRIACSLLVESNDSWRTRTIILAVVLPIVGLLLLILIILLIICCCKKRKESNYEKEMRKVPEKKVNDRNLEIMRESGIENYGYSSEKPKNTEQMRRAPTSSPDNSSFYGSGQDLEVNPELEVPYDGHDDTVLPPRITAYPVNPRKIRNLTLV